MLYLKCRVTKNQDRMDTKQSFLQSQGVPIDSDFTTAVQSFFSKRFLPKGLNTTILVIIPKKDERLHVNLVL